MMKKYYILLGIFILSLPNLLAKQEYEKLLGTNLIKNPGAEILDNSNNPIGWDIKDDIDDPVDYYGHVAGEWDYGCKNCGIANNSGEYYFRAPADLEKGQEHKSLKQSIDISKLNKLLSDSIIKFDLSAQIAGFRCNEDLKCAFGFIKIEFFDSSKQLLKDYESKRYMNEFHRVDDSDNGDSRMHKFDEIRIDKIIPKNTSYIVVTIGAEQGCNSNNNSCAAAYIFFDNLSLVLNKG